MSRSSPVAACFWRSPSPRRAWCCRPTAQAQTDPWPSSTRARPSPSWSDTRPAAATTSTPAWSRQFLGKHIPGQPTVIVQNMPGAGGLRAARNLATVAPKDGTALGMLAQTLPFDTVLGYTPDIDAGKFTWIGRAGDERRGRRRLREVRHHARSTTRASARSRPAAPAAPRARPSCRSCSTSSPAPASS